MNNRNRNIMGGLLLIAMAVCLVLWKLNVFNLPAAFAEISLFGLFIAVGMVLVIIKSIADRWYAGIFIPIAVILIIFDKPLGITAITPWVVLVAALLITIAFYMMFPRHGGCHRFVKSGEGSTSGGIHESFSENYNETANGTVDFATRFGSSTKYVRSQNLCSADLSTQFGEMSVYFDKSQVPGGVVYLNCQVAFGEMDIYIPSNWRVENKISVSLGHCESNGMNPDNEVNAVSCVIKGSVAFGELKIIRV